LVLEYGSPSEMDEDSSSILINFEGKNKWMGQVHKTTFHLGNDKVAIFEQSVDLLPSQGIVYWYRQKKIMTDEIGRPDSLNEAGNNWIAFWGGEDHTHMLNLYDLEHEYSWEMKRLALLKVDNDLYEKELRSE
jgi:hypothetical protein